MPADQIWVLTTLTAALVLLVTERLPAGITGLLSIAAVALGEAFLPEPLIASRQPFIGLIDKAVVAVGAMFVIAAGVQRTGAVGLATDLMTRGKALGTLRHYYATLVVVMVASAFMNNTPLVLIFMPVVLGIARRIGEAPSRMLIPLSFISIMGGMCTLVGTSTNIIVASSVQSASHGAVDLGMFDFLPLGAILAVAGTAYLVLARKKLLPERPTMELGPSSGLAAEYMTQVVVGEGSRLEGTTISEAFAKLGGEAGLRVLQLIRDDVIHPALPDSRLRAGDVLLVKGDPATLVRVQRPGDSGVGALEPEGGEIERGRRVALTLGEIIVPPGSRWVDRRVRDVRFGERFNVSVFAVQRHGTHLREKVEDLRLRPGDVLLVQGEVAALRALKRSDNFLVIEGVEKGVPHTDRAPVALVGLAVFMALAGVWPAQVHMIALGVALFLVVGRCLTAAEAYASLNWDVLFLLGGMLVLGRAFDECGLAARAAELVVGICGSYGELATVGGIFIFTTLITQILSNNAAAAIMTPLAYQTGTNFPGAESALPFVMAVAFGASCCFLTPVGYKTNLLVYGPGGYRFVDFLRFGLPLTILFCILATLLLPLVY
ncbi:MAG: SLC13 family permease [Planctomycetota bacterium]